MIEKRSSMMKRKAFLPEGDIPNDGFSKLYRDPTVAGNCVAVVFLNSATASVTMTFFRWLPWPFHGLFLRTVCTGAGQAHWENDLVSTSADSVTVS